MKTSLRSHAGYDARRRRGMTRQDDAATSLDDMDPHPSTQSSYIIHSLHKAHQDELMRFFQGGISISKSKYFLIVFPFSFSFVVVGSVKKKSFSSLGPTGHTQTHAHTTIIIIIRYLICRLLQIPHSLFREEGYDHREALFGVPPYGGSIAQNVYYADSDLCDPNVDTTAGYPQREKGESWPSPYILMVNRGGCTFVKKVRLSGVNLGRQPKRGIIVLTKLQ